MKVGTLILMRGKLKQMFAGDKIRYGDMNRRSISYCRWSFIGGKLSHLLWYFFRSVLLAWLVKVSLFSFVEEGEKTAVYLDSRFTTGEGVGKKEGKRLRERLKSYFGSIVFSPAFHLWKKSRWGDILYEVSHSDYEMPCAFPTVLLSTWYKQITISLNPDKTLYMKVKLSNWH